MKRFYSLLRVICLLYPLLIGAFQCCSDETIKPPPANNIDSSSHNWRFEIDTLGGPSSGAHAIVAFSENDAWVAGNFYVYPDPNDPGERIRYNVAHWDGKRWTLQQVGNTYGQGALFALNPNFILLSWFGLHLYDGYKWRQVYIPEGAITEGMDGIWASKLNEIHIIGGHGSWFIWDGNITTGNFRRIQTPTKINLKDIYGDGDAVYASGISQDYSRSVVLKYQNGSVMVVDSATTQMFFPVLSVWYHAKGNVLAYAGDRQRILHDGWKEADSLGRVIPLCEVVRGSAPNNVWWGGSFCTLLHYNGISWKTFSLPPKYGIIKSIAVQGKYFFAVGFDDSAIIIRGFKQ